MKDGIWCLLEAKGICERFQFSSSIALSIGTEQKETAFSRGLRVLILTVQWLLKGKKLKCPCSFKGPARPFASIEQQIITRKYQVINKALAALTIWSQW